jgi:site-specific DNA recombinase
LNRLLSSKLNIGIWEYGRKGERLQVAVEPLLERDLYDAVQIALRKRRQGQGRTGDKLEVYQLQGRIFCKKCGNALIGCKPHKSKSYYYCYSSIGRYKICDHVRYYHTEEIHTAVQEGLKDALRNADALEAATQIQPVAVDHSAEITRLENETKRARQAFLSGVDTLEDYEKTKKRNTARVDTLQNDQAKPPIPRDQVHIKALLSSALKEEPLHILARTIALRVHVAHGGMIELEIGVI